MLAKTESEILPAPRRFVETEYGLLGATIILKLSHLTLNFGERSGWDSAAFIHTVSEYKFPGALPSIYADPTSYHPPLSSLLVQSLSLASGLTAIQASQLISFASLLGVFLLLRQTLKNIGLLHTLFGILFLYTTAALPDFIRLSVASTYDSFAFFLGTLVLYLSIDLFWEPASFSLKKSSCRQKLILLFGTFVLGLLTKYSCLLYLSFPFVVLAVRCNRSKLLQHATIAIVTCLLAVATIAPLYHQRYYVTTGNWMPIAMDWYLGNQLEILRSERDENKIAFTLHMMRIPLTHFLRKDPITDSLLHEVWYETWKPPSQYKYGLMRVMPDIYVHLFLPFLIIGFLSFFLQHRKRGTALSDFGWILTGCALVSFVALLRFGYEYPYFPWRVFKAKYIPIAVLWMCFLCTLGLSVAAKYPRNRTWTAIASTATLSFVFMMIVMNHSIPS